MTDSDDIACGFVRAEEFAEQLGVRVQQVREWARDGILPAVRLGRLLLIPRDALERILDGDESQIPNRKGDRVGKVTVDE